MIARNCSVYDLKNALNAVNERYEGNIKFKTLEPKGKRISFTLTVVDSKAPGHRRKVNGTGRLAAACWHVHGNFFEELFKIQPLAGIYSSGSLANPRTGKWITVEGGNWQDWNLGSMVMASTACDCGPLRPTKETKGMKVFEMSSSMIKKCPLFIISPEHYKADGTCLCYDKSEQDKLKKERLERRAKTLAAIKRQGR